MAEVLCEMCHRSFKNKRSLVTHLRSHRKSGSESEAVPRDGEEASTEGTEQAVPVEAKEAGSVTGSLKRKSEQAGSSGIKKASPGSLKSPEKVSPCNTRFDHIPFLGPFISIIDMEVRDLELTPLTVGKVKPLTLVHLLRQHVDPALKMAEATFEAGKEMSCCCWLSTLWVVLFSLSSIWTAKPLGSRPTQVEDEEDAELVANEADKDVGTSNSQDSIDEMKTSHEDRSVMKKAGAVDFGIKVVWKAVSERFRVQVWKMLADTKDTDLRANWLSKTLPQLMRYGQAYGIENVCKGRLGSIHLMSLSRGLFSVAELDCIGVLEVANEKITEESWSQFEKDERRHWQLMQSKSASYRRPRVTRKDVEARVEAAKGKLSATGGEKLSSQKYLVADLYVLPEPENWDDYGSKVPAIYGTLYLLEYLLQALIGKSVRNWTPEEIDKRIEAKKKTLSRDQWFQDPEAIAKSYLLRK